MNRKNNTIPYRQPKQLRRSQSYIVEAGETRALLAYLVEVALTDKSRTTVKQLLHDRFISLNGKATTQWDAELKAGDTIALHAAPLPKDLVHKQVEILWQDEHLVMLHKRAGIPTVRSGEERDKTAMELVSEHLKRFDPRAKVYLLNRLDKDCSGFVLMARTEALQQEMSERWEQYVERQSFAVVVEGELEPEGTLHAPAPEPSKGGRTPKRREGSTASAGASGAGEARYSTLMQGEGASLLSVQLLRGRNNRLRRQFAALRCPIMGDWRNGSNRKELGRVLLEMTAFSFVHPVTKLKYDFKQPVPASFRRELKPKPSPSRGKQAQTARQR